MSKRLTASEIAFGIVVETTQAIETAQAMIRDAKLAAHAKHTASQHTNCRQCQAALENFLMEYPDCSEEVIHGQLQESWETCGACREEYQAHLDRQAERSQYSDLDGHCFNGDDHRWQNGGVK